MRTGTCKPLIVPGTMLGIGLGGFIDGIVFHQILQMHSMLSARLPKDTVANLQINMFWDGMFHAFTWLMTAIGLALLWRAVNNADIRLSGKVMLGSLFLGWGLFNFVEGLIDHHLLELHHVVEARGASVFDGLFLLSGVVMSVGGFLAIRSALRGEGEVSPVTT